MPFRPNKSTPKVKDGKVQKKNRHAETPNYWNTPQAMPTIDRRRPGAGRVHLLKRRDIENFIALLPDWAEVSRGLNAIVLQECEVEVEGMHSPAGVVVIASWPRTVWECTARTYVLEHKPILDRLGVAWEDVGNGYRIKWTEAQAKAFQLLHVLLHELGHHRDRMTTISQRRTARGEGYAEQYATKHIDLIWERYKKAFDPRGEHFPRT